eukprot:1190668-Prorocentrum_minimum.AAC.2
MGGPDDQPRRPGSLHPEIWIAHARKPERVDPDAHTWRPGHSHPETRTLTPGDPDTHTRRPGRSHPETWTLMPKDPSATLRHSDSRARARALRCALRASESAARADPEPLAGRSRASIQR